MENHINIIKILARQLELLGETTETELDEIKKCINHAYEQTEECCEKYVGLPTKLNLLQTHHNALFLYNLSRMIFDTFGDEKLSTKIFLLNRLLNGVDMYFKINLPKYLIIAHGLGIVFSKATYSEYLVIFQNTTIGVSSGKYPKIGEKVIIYPNCVIAGNTTIGKNCVISAGSIIIDKCVPDNSLVFGGNSIAIKENKKNIIKNYFDI